MNMRAPNLPCARCKTAKREVKSYCRQCSNEMNVIRLSEKIGTPCIKCNTELRDSAHSSYCYPCRYLTLRNNSFKRLYGITLEEYEIIRELQDGYCANPRCKNEIGEGLDSGVDHNHLTGQVRGILCNRALGILRESPDTIRGLAEYIEKWS